VYTVAGQAALAKYPYGIMPHDASLAGVKAKWVRWQEYYVTSVGCPDPNTMLRACQGLVHEKAPNHEGHGYAMVFAAAETYILNMEWEFRISCKTRRSGHAGVGCLRFLFRET
jgi:hypothetical protein